MAQGGGRGPEGDLRGGDCRRGRTQPRSLRQEVGRAVAYDQQELAGELGAADPLHELSAGDKAGG